MKISFTTLACPNWDLDTIVERAVEYGFDAVDFRGTKAGLDIALQSEFTEGLERTADRIRASGLIVSGVSSSLGICDAERFEANIEEARRTILVARGLGARQVRVFGNGDLAQGRDALIDQGVRCMEAVSALDGAEQIDWLLETHDNWIASAHCLSLVEAVGWDCFGLLWDIGHTTRFLSDSLESTYALIGPRTPCVHLKDARYEPEEKNAMEDGWRYVLPGEGNLPLDSAVRLLKSSDFDGWYVFEHEKRWHPDLDEPEVALPAFVNWIRDLK